MTDAMKLDIPLKVDMIHGPTWLTPISEAERARSTLNTDETVAEIFTKHMDAMDNSVADVNEP